MLKLRRPFGVLFPEAGQLITHEDVCRRELAPWRMLYELPAQSNLNAAGSRKEPSVRPSPRATPRWDPCRIPIFGTY